MCIRQPIQTATGVDDGEIGERGTEKLKIQRNVMNEQRDHIGCICDRVACIVVAINPHVEGARCGDTRNDIVQRGVQLHEPVEIGELPIDPVNENFTLNVPVCRGVRNQRPTIQMQASREGSNIVADVIC